MHLSESVFEPTWVKEHLNSTPVEVYDKLGYLDDKVIASQEFRSMTDVAVIDQNFDARQREISELYVRAQKLYKAKQYTKARDLCEAIFIKDPYNQKAVELLNKVYKQMYFYSELPCVCSVRSNFTLSSKRR